MFLKSESNVFRRYTTQIERQACHARLTRIARLLDSRFRLPGTDFRFGIDGLIGLVPVVGDVVMALMSLYIVHQAWRLRTPWKTLALMVLNVVGDLIVSEIPVAGDLADFFYKSNRMNLRMLGITGHGMSDMGITGLPASR